MTSIQTAATQSRIVPTHMAHLVFKCADRPSMVNWYKAVFQADLVFEDEILTFLAYDEEHHRLAFFNMPKIEAQDKKASGVHHIAYSYGSIGDLLSTYVRLKKEDIKPNWCINHGPTTSLYYRDPENNDIELQVDNYPTSEEAAAYFHSQAFADNPIGVEFDPDELVRLWENGASDQELSVVGTAATGKSLGPQ